MRSQPIHRQPEYQHGQHKVNEEHREERREERRERREERRERRWCRRHGHDPYGCDCQCDTGYYGDDSV